MTFVFHHSSAAKPRPGAFGPRLMCAKREGLSKARFDTSRLDTLRG
jgi:hypothetical protein